MKNAIVPIAALCAVTLFATPSVTVTGVLQDSLTKKVTVEYDLFGAPAIVTMTVETNSSGWTAIPGSALRAVSGDIGGIVRSDSAGLTATWRPEASWPGQALASGEARVVLKAWSLDSPPDYAVFDLIVTNEVRFYESEAQLPIPVTDDRFKTDCLVMRRIPAANVVWRMGPAANEPTASTEWEVLHQVRLTNDYYMAVFELTQAQYSRICRRSYDGESFVSYKGRPKAPAVGIRWTGLRGNGSDYDFPTKGRAVAADSVIGLLRAHTGQDFDLPTDAQWEYAARAGVAASFQNGMSDPTRAEVIALNWFKNNSEDNLHAVGEREANAWGLHDVHGNCCEWCLDWMSADISAYTVEPEGPAAAQSSGTTYPMAGCRVVRGGSISENSVTGRFARRGWESEGVSRSYIGARFCLPARLK